jgi:hypothetical protein
MKRASLKLTHANEAFEVCEACVARSLRSLRTLQSMRSLRISAGIRLARLQVPQQLQSPVVLAKAISEFSDQQVTTFTATAISQVLMLHLLLLLLLPQACAHWRKKQNTDVRISILVVFVYSLVSLVFAVFI